MRSVSSKLNRSIIVIVPKKPFYDWINYIEPSSPIQDMGSYDAFLAPYDMPELAAEKWLKANYRAIFENQLEGMWEEKAEWPQQRTFEVFEAWFDWFYAPVIYDMG